MLQVGALLAPVGQSRKIDKGFYTHRPRPIGFVGEPGRAGSGAVSRHPLPAHFTVPGKLAQAYGRLSGSTQLLVLRGFAAIGLWGERTLAWSSGSARSRSRSSGSAVFLLGLTIYLLRVLHWTACFPMASGLGLPRRSHWFISARAGVEAMQVRMAANKTATARWRSSFCVADVGICVVELGICAVRLHICIVWLGSGLVELVIYAAKLGACAMGLGICAMASGEAHRHGDARHRRGKLDICAVDLDI